MNNLAQKIENTRIETGLNKSNFARLMGFSRGKWYLILKGERRLNTEDLRAVINNFPQLTFDVLDYLYDGHEE